MLVASTEDMATTLEQWADRLMVYAPRDTAAPRFERSFVRGTNAMQGLGGRGGWPGDDGSIRDESGFVPLFDGKADNWLTAGHGHFAVVGDRLESVPGEDFGVFWCTVPTPRDFVLRLRWLRWRHEDTSAIFVRFPRPQADPAQIAERGFEVRLDEVGIPGETCIYRTGAILNQALQRLTPRAAHPPMEWNDLEVTVVGQRYGVVLNGRPVTVFVNPDPMRGRASAPDVPSFMGLQLFPGARVAFRDIRIKALS
jgi:3-keto-disaccharide hydrolase